MPVTLTKPAPRQGSALEDFQALLTEWLTGWFNGTDKPYGTGGDSLTWPVLTSDNIAFGQFALPANLDGAHFGIQVIGQGGQNFDVAPLAPDTRRRLVETRATVMIYVRVKIQPGNTTWKSSDDALATYAGRLHGLLDSVTACDALNAKTVYPDKVRESALPNTEGCAMALLSFNVIYRAFHT